MKHFFKLFPAFGNIHPCFILTYVINRSLPIFDSSRISVFQLILCVPVAFAQTTRETLSFAFFFPRVLLTSSNGISNVYLGNNRKKNLFHPYYMHFRDRTRKLSYITYPKLPKVQGFSLSTSAPSPWRRSCSNPRRSLNRLNQCHDA